MPGIYINLSKLSQNVIFTTTTSSIKHSKSTNAFPHFTSNTAILGPPYSITDRAPDPPDPQSPSASKPAIDQSETQIPSTDRQSDPQTSQRSTQASPSSTTPHGTDTSHDADSRIAPEKLQEKLPQEDEERVSDPTHDAGSSADMTGVTGVSRAVEGSEMSKTAGGGAKGV